MDGAGRVGGGESGPKQQSFNVPMCGYLMEDNHTDQENKMVYFHLHFHLKGNANYLT